MEFKTAYDLDGTLCENPSEATKSYFKMIGPERQERREYLLKFYKEAKIIYDPLVNKFIVLTGRKNTADVVLTTNQWLVKAYPDKEIKCYFLDAPRTLKSIVGFKARILNELNIKRYFDDREANLRQLKKLVNNTKLFLIKDGTIIKKI